MRIVALSACVALSRLASVTRRSLGAAAAATWAGLALFAGGCSSLDAIYVREGIGTTLSTTALPEVTRLEQIYVGEICRQAGLRVIVQRYPNGNGEVVLCDEVGMRPSEWTTFVQAGMNDIDRRCDAYLAWLDNKRRWREPILKQINITAATTAAILGLTGVGATPIAIVGTAFGFAEDTFVNFHSRLITEINHSVIQLVVLDNQNKFRVSIVGLVIDNRPAAIYVLRNYLRICMPFSIEMSINNTMTVYHRAGPEALVRTVPILAQPAEVARITSTRFVPVVNVDLTAQRIRAYLANPANQSKVDAWLEKNGSPDPRAFLVSPRYLADRGRMIRELGIP